jgi:hypothetical protein
MKYLIPILFLFVIGCDVRVETSDDIQRKQQELLLQEGTSQVGMPAIKNFRERKILKDIIELRDQEGLITYTYLFSEQTGKLVFLGETIGYGIPYATQFTNPTKLEAAYLLDKGFNGENLIVTGSIPQADPNGLYSPASAEGTWILMRDPVSSDVLPQYIEPRIMVFTFKLADNDSRLVQ